MFSFASYKKILLSLVAVITVNIAFSQENSSSLANYVYSLQEKVVSENRLAGSFNPDSVSSLPVGIIREIGITRYIIALDSAVFTPMGSLFNAYMALEFPGSDQKIAFAAKGVSFNPKGVAGGSNTRLMLVSEHRISIGPNITLVIMPDGRNYVDWDCNGFKSVNLKGYFEFAPGLLLPDPEVANDGIVKASFEMNTQDIHHFIAQVSITPFCIKGLKDFSFTVLDATVDMSELENAPGIIFPTGYSNANGSLWTGFYIKQFRVKLPEELSKKSGRVEAYANNFIIDKSGVSGSFQLTNVLPLADGNMSGWNFSVDRIGVNIVSNHLNGGNMSGTIQIPVMEENALKYNASLIQDPVLEEMNYAFEVQTEKDVNIPVFSAKMDIYNTSVISVKKLGGRFKPSALLNGNLSLDHENAKVKGIEFQQLIIESEKPYLKNGIFSLVSSDNSEHKLAQFPISITNLSLVVNATAPAISFKVALGFMEQQDKGFSVETQVHVIGKIEETPAGMAGETTIYKTKWSFDRVKIEEVAINSNTNFFKLNGVIAFREYDPVYGKGFFGKITLQMDKMMESPFTVNACFGKKEDYKYWYVDAAVPIKIPIGSGLSIFRLMGGLYYHMRQPPENLSAALYKPAFEKAQTYIPDKTIGIGFKAGVTLATSSNDKVVNGDITLEIAFNSSGGLNFIRFTGDVFCMVSINDRITKPVDQIPIRASMEMTYDNTNKSFHAVLNTYIKMSALNGSGQAVIHFDPDVWYICIGKPSNRFTVEIAKLASVQAYFMVGNQLEPMPPVPDLVASIVGSSGLGNKRDQSQLLNAKGLVFGASLQASAYRSFGFDFFEIYGGFALVIGFDMMIVDYGAKAVCSGSGAKPGINGWYSMGQVYTAMQGNVGVRGHVRFLPGCNNLCIVDSEFGFNVLSGSVAAVISAQLPKPYYFAGKVACQYNILDVVKGDFDFNFSLGNYCTVVQ